MAGVQPEITDGSREDAHSRALTNMAWPEAARFLAYIRRAKVRPSRKSVSLAIRCNKQCNKPKNLSA
jgi:hypothetical protein